MKRILIPIIAALSLSSCAVNPSTGKRELTPEALEAMNRAGTRVLLSAEKYVTAEVDKILRVDTGK